MHEFKLTNNFTFNLLSTYHIGKNKQNQTTILPKNVKWTVEQVKHFSLT